LQTRHGVELKGIVLISSPGDLARAVSEARAFATGAYVTALVKGNSMTDAEREAVAQKMARLTGLSADYIERTNLRLDPDRSRTELLRDRRQTVGRLDSRFNATDVDAAGDTEEFDPSNTALFSDDVKSNLTCDAGPRIGDQFLATRLRSDVAKFLTSNAGTAARSTTTPQP